MRPARATSKTIFAGLLACACFRAAQAGPSTSANYSIVAETTDFGGKHAVSGAYANDGSLSAVAGLSAGATPVETLKSGYVGQLYDVTGLSVTSSSDPATVNGGATLLLGAWQILDDGSYLAVDPGSVTWMVVSGPITGISPEGLATAGAPSQNMAATVRGTYAGYTGTLGLTVTLPSADFTSATQTPIVSDGYTATGNSIDLTLGFTPTTGTVLTVIDNIGSGPIQGTFTNLAQGQIVNLSYEGHTYSFLANYHGGPHGNSLVLQLSSEVPAMPGWASLALIALLLAVGAIRLSKRPTDTRGSPYFGLPGSSLISPK